MTKQNTMTVSQFASLGGKARAEKLSAKRRAAISASGEAEARRLGRQLGRPRKVLTIPS
jgi:hypothetical protein